MSENEVDCEGCSVVTTHVRVGNGFRFRECRARENWSVQEIVQAEVNLLHGFQCLELSRGDQYDYVLTVCWVYQVADRYADCPGLRGCRLQVDLIRIREHLHVVPTACDAGEIAHAIEVILREFEDQVIRCS